MPGRFVNHLGKGNGCPEQRSFDVLIPAGSPRFGIPAPDDEYATGIKTAEYASIANDAQTAGSLNYRTVVDGISLSARRDGGACEASTPPSSIQQRLSEVLTWFGHASGAPCADPSAGTGIDPLEPQSFRTSLSSFAPNPLVAGASGRIAFTMSRNGQARVEIFDCERTSGGSGF